MPKKELSRGLSQEERRRRSANRPIGGGGTPQQFSSRKKDEGLNNTRLQRWSGIIGIIMLVALLLSLIPACYYSNAGAAELPASAAHIREAAHLDLTLLHSLASAPAGETPLAVPVATNLSSTATGHTADSFQYWLGNGGANLLRLASSESE